MERYINLHMSSYHYSVQSLPCRYTNTSQSYRCSGVHKGQSSRNIHRYLLGHRVSGYSGSYCGTFSGRL